MYASTENKSYGKNGDFLITRGLHDQFAKNYVNILISEFNARVRSDDIFKPTIWDESSHEISIDNRLGV